MPRSRFHAVLVLVAALMPAAALATSVFLNGVKIDGVTNTRFEKATVRIDEQGNVHIDAPGYAARVVAAPPAAAPTPAPAPAPEPAPTAPAAPAPAPAPQAAAPAAPAPAAEEEEAPGRITRRYWLVAEQSVPGMTEYEIEVYVNSKWIRKLRNNEEQVVVEITRHLQPGRNTVLLNARKVVADSRRSVSPAHTFKVIIGEGNMGGGNVMIDNPLIRFQRSAADAQDASEEFTLTTR